jgi:hypothetical protein
MGDFQAVDLDAVLDQFEFHEEERQKKQQNVDTTATSKPSTTLVTATTSAPPMYYSYDNDIEANESDVQTLKLGHDQVFHLNDKNHVII